MVVLCAVAAAVLEWLYYRDTALKKLWLTFKWSASLLESINSFTLGFGIQNQK